MTRSSPSSAAPRRAVPGAWLGRPRPSPYPVRLAPVASAPAQAESWLKARANRSPEASTAYFDALGRSTHLADWQFRQAVDAAGILACDILSLPWAADFPWASIPGPSHPAAPGDPAHIPSGQAAATPDAGSHVPPASEPAGKHPAQPGEIAGLIANTRAAIRVRGYSPRTEDTYLQWVNRYLDFHHRQHPAKLGPQSINR